VFVLLPLAVLLAAVVVGCTGSKPDEDDDKGDAPRKDRGKGAAATLTAVKATGTGTLKGRVTKKGNFDVQKENEGLQAKIGSSKDQKDQCLAADVPENEKEQQKWLGKGDGVQYAVVFLKPPKDQFFDVPAEDRKLKSQGGTVRDEVALNQPHCAFLPHVDVLFPSYKDKDGKTDKETGQVFKVTNSAKFSHNTHYTGDNNKEDNQTINPGGLLPVKLKPSVKEPVSFVCDIHKWMSAYVWVLDHPYAAVTDENGNYEIKNVPLGADVQVVVWHELSGPQTETTKFTDKETTKDFGITPK
jgi:hypothetical protein